MNKCVPIFVIIILASCSHSSNYHLPQHEMTNMLTDLQAAEVYSTIVKKDSLERGFTKNMDSLAVFYKEIFVHYKVTQQQFDESLEWYKMHPDEMDTIYAKILPELTKYDK
jgi:hypothetical protein